MKFNWKSCMAAILAGLLLCLEWVPLALAAEIPSEDIHNSAESSALVCICGFFDFKCTEQNIGVVGSLQSCEACKDDISSCVGTKTCSCSIQCSLDEGESSCSVCSLLPAACQGMPESGGCTCSLFNIKCTEENFAMLDVIVNCSVCKDDIHSCAGTLECSCEVKCEDGIADNRCSVCSLLSAACTGQACICPEEEFVCQEGEVNESCPACSQGLEHCMYQCVCQLSKYWGSDPMVCTEDSRDIYCVNVCQKNPENCRFSPKYAEDMERQLLELPGRPVSLLEDATIDHTIEIHQDTVIRIHESALKRGVKVHINRTMNCLNEPVFFVKSGAVLTLEGVNVSGNSQYLTSYAPLIEVEEGGTLILDNASLQNNENLGGNGGAISCAGGTVRLLDGCAVKGNEALRGAGIYLAGGAVLSMEGSAMVSQNTAAEAGGGIYAGDQAEITVGGTPAVRANMAAGRDNNLYLLKTAGSISLDGQLKSGAEIWVSMEEEGIFARKGGAVENRDIRAFSSDSGSYICAGEGVLELKENPDSVLQGRILLENKPVQNAQVILIDREDHTEIARAMTDREGIYRVSEQVNSISCRALVSVKLEEPYAACVDVVSSDTGAARSSLPDIPLEKGYYISGCLSGGVAEAGITGKDGNGTEFGRTVSYGEGYYDMVVPGSCYLTAEGKQGDKTCTGNSRVEVTDSGNATGTNILMKEGIFVTGTVVDSNESPAEGVMVTFYEEAASRAALPENAVPVSTAVTNSVGRYEAASLREGAEYQVVVFAEKSGEAAVYKVVVRNQEAEIVNGNGDKSILRLEKAMEISGTFIYFKTIFHSSSWTDDGYPQNLKLVLRLENGAKAAEGFINPGNGAFTLSPVLEGSYFASVVRTDDENICLSTEGPLFQVHGDGSITVDGSSLMLLVDEPEIAPDNVIMLQTKEAIDLWANYLLRLEPSDIDNPDVWIKTNIEVINYINTYLKSDLNPIERDMLPLDLAGCVNGWLDYLASRYKVTVSVENHAENVIRKLETDLSGGSQEDASVSAKRIAAHVANQAGLSLEDEVRVNLILKAEPARQSGVAAIEDALVSGEILKFFDMELLAEYGISSNPVLGSRKLTDALENIKIELDLNDFSYDPEQEYVVVRCHEKNGTRQVEIIDASIQEGRVTFFTDRFSTYAIAYSKPGEGIVIEVADNSAKKPGDGGHDGGSSGESSGIRNDIGSQGNGIVMETTEINERKEPLPENRTDEKPEKAPENTVVSVVAQDRYQSDGYDSQYAFWLSARENILKAVSGGTVKINCKDYPAMPSMVIEALAGRDITLVISYNGGSDIVLYGNNITAQKDVTYYTFDMLSEMAKEAEEKENRKEETAGDEKGEPLFEEREKLHQEPVIMEKSDVLRNIQSGNDRSRFVLVAAAAVFAGAAAAPLLLRKGKRGRMS